MMKNGQDEKAAEASVGQRMIAGLQEVLQVLEKGEKLEDHFVCRMVETRHTPEQIQETRALLKADQPTFARLIGVTVSTVRAWEQGKNRPSEMAKRFMDEIRHDPNYWRKRMKTLFALK